MKACERSKAVHFFRSCLRAEVEEIAAILRDLRNKAAGFLCSPDCVAERVGFEFSVLLNLKELRGANCPCKVLMGKKRNF